MAFRFTNADFENLITSEAANEDIIGILRDIQHDPGSWRIFEAMVSLSNLRAAHLIAGALRGIDVTLVNWRHN